MLPLNVGNHLEDGGNSFLGNVINESCSICQTTRCHNQETRKQRSLDPQLLATGNGRLLDK
jgi:hypothetical protein